MGIFKIAKAEFIKLFKKPSIYIMALALLVVILLSTTFFQPTKVSNYMVRDLGDTVGDIYTTYKGTDGKDNETNYKSELFSAIGKMNYYENNNKRNEQIDLTYSTLSDAYFLYLDTVRASQDDNNPNKAQAQASLATVKQSFILALQEYKTALGNFDHIESYDYSTLSLYTEYLNSSNYTEMINTIETIETKSATSSSPTSFFNYLETEKCIEELETLATTHKDFVTIVLAEKVADIEARYKTLTNYGNINNFRIQSANLINAIDNLKNYYNNLFSISPILKEGTTNDKLLIVITKNHEYKSIIEELDKYKQTLTYDGKTIEPQTTLQEIQKNNYNTTIKSYFNKITTTTVSQKTIDQLSQYLIKNIYPHIDSIMGNGTITGSITDLYNEHAASNSLSDTKAILTEITKAKSVTTNTNLYVSNTLTMECVHTLSDEDIQQIKANNLTTYSTYQYKEANVRLDYLLSTRHYDYQYDHAFADGMTSGTKTNAFDFMFYALKWSVLLVVIYSIAMACSSIATEQENGTIKLLLVRPYKRFKIIIGKFLSIISFAFIFMLFSFIVSFFIGYGMFGLSGQTILAVFNATSAYTIHPFLLIIVDFLLSLCEVLLFVFIAIMFATLFRTFASSFSLSLIVITLIIFLNIVLGAVPFFGILPIANFNLFKFLGGAFRSGEIAGINSLFATRLVGITNIWLGVIYDAILAFICMLVTYFVFKKRDY